MSLFQYICLIIYLDFCDVDNNFLGEVFLLVQFTPWTFVPALSCNFKVSESVWNKIYIRGVIAIFGKLFSIQYSERTVASTETDNTSEESFLETESFRAWHYQEDTTPHKGLNSPKRFTNLLSGSLGVLQTRKSCDALIEVFKFIRYV